MESEGERRVIMERKKSGRKRTPEGCTEWADKEGKEGARGGQGRWRDSNDWEKRRRDGGSSSKGTRRQAP